MLGGELAQRVGDDVVRFGGEADDDLIIALARGERREDVGILDELDAGQQIRVVG